MRENSLSSGRARWHWLAGSVLAFTLHSLLLLWLLPARHIATPLPEAAPFVVELAPQVSAPHNSQMAALSDKVAEERVARQAGQPIATADTETKVQPPQTDIAKRAPPPTPEQTNKAERVASHRPEKKVTPTAEHRQETRRTTTMMQPKQAVRETRAATPVSQKQSEASSVMQSSHHSEQVKGPIAGTARSENLSQAVKTWQNQISLKLEKNKHYPRVARKKRQEGIVVLRFSMNRQGEILDAVIERSAGFSLLDEEVLSLIRRIQPLPTPPAEVEGERITRSVSIDFSIRSL